jgi:hypothetical protein
MAINDAQNNPDDNIPEYLKTILRPVKTINIRTIMAVMWNSSICWIH